MHKQKTVSFLSLEAVNRCYFNIERSYLSQNEKKLSFVHILVDFQGVVNRHLQKV